MNRYWVSWWSGDCTNGAIPAFQYWISGERDRPKGGGSDLSLCAVISARTEGDIWRVIKRHFPGAEERFCNPVEGDWTPGDRFPGFENRTRLEE